MACGIKLPSFKSELMKKEMLEYIKPKFVYIPLISQNDTNVTVLVKKGDYVLKDSIIGKRKGKIKMPIHSSVSGKVIGFEDKYYLNNSKVKCVVIENDMLEKTANKSKEINKISEISKENFIKRLNENGIVGLGGAGFPTYLKYDTDKNIKHLIINAVECEPYLTSDATIIQKKCEEILETIDAIVTINNIETAYFCIKGKNITLKNIINTYIGTYLKIKLVEVKDIYPNGWERSLVKQVLGVTYNNIPLEKGIIVNNVSTINAMYEALKFNKPLTERIITIAGEGIEDSYNVLVKNGTEISEVIQTITKYKNGELKLIAAGPMMGDAISTDELIVTSTLNGVIITKDIEEQLLECIRCGKCVDVCPAKLSPVLIKDNLKTPDVLKDLKVDRCIECGLCSYICPSKILVREFVKKAKKIIKEVNNK